jgi:glycosyltransferase involved in cell wall biosynthesis
MKSCAVLCFSPYFGGMDMDSLKIAKLISDSVNVTFICKKGTSLEERGIANHEGMNFESIEFKSMLSLNLASRLRKILKRDKIENIIFFGASELGSIAIASFGLGINIIVQHGTTKKRSKKDPYHWLTYSSVNHHVAVSRHIARNVLKIIPSKESQMKVIYTSLSLKNLPNRPPQISEKIKLLHVGRIAMGKGHAEAIKACNILHQQGIDFELTFVGEADPPEMLEEITKQIDQTSYADKIMLAGYSSNVGKFYSESNIFLFPSHGEGMSNAFLEALAYGLQCVCFDNTAFPELQEDFDFHIYLAKNKDLESLQKQLLSAVNELPRSLELVETNMKKIKENFSTQTAKEKFLDLLN